MGAVQAKVELLNHSVVLNGETHARRFPTWSMINVQVGDYLLHNPGPDGQIEYDKVWDARVVGVDGEFYQLLFTLADGSQKQAWIHNIWVKGGE